MVYHLLLWVPCGGNQNWAALKESSPSFWFGDISVEWVVIGHLLLQQLVLISIRLDSWRWELFQGCKKKLLSWWVGVNRLHSLAYFGHSWAATPGRQCETLPQSKTCHFLENIYISQEITRTWIKWPPRKRCNRFIQCHRRSQYHR